MLMSAGGGEHCLVHAIVGSDTMVAADTRANCEAWWLGIDVDHGLWWWVVAPWWA